jgi:hypothetical protein
MKTVNAILENLNQKCIFRVNEGRSVDDNERKLDEFLKNNLKGFKKGRFFGEYEGNYWNVSTDCVSIRILGEDSLEFLYDDYTPAGIEKSYQTMLSFLKEAQDELKFIVSVLKKAESEGIMLER